MESASIDLNSILKNSKSEIELLFSNLDQITDAYEYERRFVEIGRKITYELIAASLGKVPKSKNSKKKF